MIEATKKIRAMGLDAFLATYRINATRADGLISLKYNQSESPMHEPCVADCRGLVVRDDDPTQVVCMGYRKFWNLGEKHADPIDWSTARVMEKLDGSLMMLYRHEGRWCVASSGTPNAGGPYNGDGVATFADAFWEAWSTLGYRLPLDEDPRWFFFEFCAPNNRIVVKYDRPRLVLHGARHSQTLAECNHDDLLGASIVYGWETVGATSPGLIGVDAIVAMAAGTDPLGLEGFVVVDAAFRRVKVKNPRYVEIHHLRGNRSPRAVVELWKAGEVGEVLAHFPEMAPDFDAVIGPLDEAIAQVGHAWQKHGGIADRKTFAGEVKNLPFASVLFRLHTDKTEDATHAIGEHVRAMNTSAVLRAIGAG